MKEEYKNYTRSVSIICLFLGVVFTLFTMGTLTSLLTIFVFQAREATGEVSLPGLLISMTVGLLIGGSGLASFFLRKTKRGWNLARILGAVLAVSILALPWLLQSERPGIPPIGSLSLLILSFAGIWVFQVTSDKQIRLQRENS